MDEFVWDSRFETGIGKVDSQHQQLVVLTNELCKELLEKNDIHDEGLEVLFQRLTDYTRYHFADEECNMLECGIDPRHYETHVARHAQLFEQLVVLKRSYPTIDKPAQAIHTFLASWLTVHILGYDQTMARQLARIKRGESAIEAFNAEERSSDTGTAVLLDALSRLYDFISQQNQSLSNLNLTLEQRIEERSRKLAETSRQLLQAEKLAAIGQLAAGVAHEINNPISFINSNIYVMKEYVGELLNLVEAYEAGDREAVTLARKAVTLDLVREDLPALIEESEKGLHRVTKIVSDLKEFSHVDQAEFQKTDLNAALEGTLNVLWHELKDKTEIVRELGVLPEVDCMPAKIKQVFLNIVLNACQAIEKKGRITVRSGVANGLVWMEIVDNGKGIPPEDRDRIFEPFFTTRPVGKGTGLGLTVCHDIIVKEHHGRIDVHSEPGEGSCFRVWLPIRFGAL